MKKDRDRHPCTLPYYRVTSLTVSLTVNVLLLVIRCCCSSDSRRILVIDAFSYTPAGRCKVSPTLRGSSCRPIVLFFATSSDGSDGNERAAVTATTNNSTKTATPQAVNGEDTTATTTNALEALLSASSNDLPSPKETKKKATNVRMRVFSYLNRPSVEVASALAVLLSSFLVALDTLPTLPISTATDSHMMIQTTLEIINVVFAVDFFVRWYAAGNFKAIYLSKPLVALDILVVLVPLCLGSIEFFLGSVGFGCDIVPPSLMIGSAGLQNLLLLRILRLRRVLTDITTYTRFEGALLGRRPKDVRPYQLQLARVLLSIFTLLSVASGLIYTTEHGVNPAIPDYFAALYFGLTTLSKKERSMTYIYSNF
jgi:Ion transport protein